MSRKVDPKVDCVFKAILGAEANTNLLIHFLNAVLRPPEAERITAVELLNPFKDKEYEEDKLSIVDVSARDKAGRVFQIEIQLHGIGSLVPRIVYNFCDLVASQLKDGENYRLLRPVIAIWILNGVLIQGSTSPHHTFCLYDAGHGVTLDPRYQIHTLELPRWEKAPVVEELDRWVWFLRHGDEVDPGGPLPEVLNTPEMRQAMGVLKQISEKEQDYRAYQARMNFLRQQSGWIEEAEEARKLLDEQRKVTEEAFKAAEEARQETAEAHRREAQAREENERLRKLLESVKLPPDESGL